ncbi:unnamed protein product [Parajaminaea phylloscopi]
MAASRNATQSPPRQAAAPQTIRSIVRTQTSRSVDSVKQAAKRITWSGAKPYDDCDGNDSDTGYAGGPFRGAEETGVPSESNLSSNGIRVWYDSYTTIDWIHDSIKESSRLRRIRGLRGFRGLAINAWDRSQGWLIVTLTGILTSIVAGAIVESEAVLFDLKDGYCSKDWKLAKRFCCPYGGDQDWDRDPALALSHSNTTRSTLPWKSRGLLTGPGTELLAGWAGPVARSPKWASAHATRAGTTAEDCPGWTRWSELLSASGRSSWLGDYGVYVLVALLWASVACLMTLYLTSSELYVSRKDVQKGARPTTSSVPAEGPAQTDLRRDGDISDERTRLLSPTKRSRSYTSTPQSTSTSAMPAKALAQYASDLRAQAANAPRKVLYFGSGSGISEIKCILSGFVIHGYLGFWTLFTKSVGLTLAVASGLSLGKEGPFVHIASCVGNIVCRLFDKYDRNESKRREILSCACAAGVAVAFGAPVGGVLFSFEEVSYYFPAKVMFRSFFCAMIAAAGLRFIDPFGTSKIVLFQVSYDKDWAFQELPLFVLLGVFGGLYGALFTRLNMIWSKRVRAKTWMATHPLLEVLLVTLVTVTVSFLNDYTKMGGPELITDLFSECHEHESLDGLCVSQPSQLGPLVSSIAWAMIVRGLLTIVTFGIKLPAGIFIPSLAVGACFGRIVGLLVQWLQWTRPHLGFFSWCSASDDACIVPGIYAMVGAAATLSGVTRTSVSLAVIMFELTGTLTYSIPIMVSILVARTLADALEHKGIYDLVMEFSGLPYLDAKASYTWRGVTVADAMDTGIEYIHLDENNTVTSLRAKIERLALGHGYADGGFPLVWSQGTQGFRMAGYIAAQELEHGLKALADTISTPDLEATVCTFSHLPRGQSAGATEDGEIDEDNGHMRDSIFLSTTDLRDLSRYVDKA